VLLLALGAIPEGARAQSPSPLLPRAGLDFLQVQPPPAAARSPAGAPRYVPMWKAALLSAVLPGLGEAYSGHTNRAIVQGSVEAGIWISYATFKVQEDLRGDRAREFAIHYAGAVSSGNEDYYKAVGQFLRAEGPGMWNEYVRRQLRDTGEVVGREYTGGEAWAWTSEERYIDYRRLRRDMLTADDRATNMLAFAILNRVVSVASVVQAVRSDHARAREFGLRIEPGDGRFEIGRLGLWNRF
jgi:hypothetical protein